MRVPAHISKQDLIESILLLRGELFLEKVPENYLNDCFRDNPWFSEFYVSHSLDEIRLSLEESSLRDFLRAYPVPVHVPKKVAIIAAGNLPLVCFHDVLMTVLSGHICLLKRSHQDRALISYVHEKWIEILPELATRFQLVDEISSADFLISTGSNNTARYIQAKFPHIPKLVRRNRYSVGILKAEMTEEEMKGLSKDIFLYNGLGCRNVSNLLIYPEADLQLFYEILKDYPQKHLHPLYLERVLYERVRLEQVGGNFTVFPNILVRPSSQFSFASMGLIHGVFIQQEEFQEAEELLARHKGDIQTVVGRETAYGKAQSPSLKDFADNVDTLKLLSTLSTPLA